MYLAQTLGLFFLIGGLGVLLNKKKYHDMDIALLKEQPTVLLFAMIMMVMGLLLILKHNIWEFGAAGLITLVGWVVFLKGAIIMLMPDMLDMFKKKDFAMKWYTIGGVLWLIAGLYLTYIGFFA